MCQPPPDLAELSNSLLCTYLPTSHLPPGRPCRTELEDYLSLGQVNVQIMFLKDGRLFNEELGNPFIIIHSISLLRAEEHSTVTLLLQTEEEELNKKGSGFFVSLE